jgi:hypothetical protein
VDFQRGLSNINCVANAIETAPKVSLSPCVNGWRTDIVPTVSLNLDGPGYLLRPAVSYRATQYDLSNILPGEDKSPSRTVPLADVDLGLQFERALGADAERKVTLEPRPISLTASNAARYSRPPSAISSTRPGPRARN